MFPDSTLPDLLSAGHPDATAILYEDQRITYAALRQRVRRLAAGLHGIGVRPGNRVALLLPNCPEFVEAMLATATLGAITVPLSTRLGVVEVESLLSHSEASVLIATPALQATVGTLSLPALKHVFALGEEYHQLLSDGIAPAVTDASRVALILYTSGTTGQPKGVMLSHRNAVWTALNVNAAMQVTQDDVFLLVVPLYHVFGAVTGVACTLAAGASMVLMETFRAPQVLETVQRHQCTVLHGTPTMFVLELNAPDFDRYDLHSLRTGIIAAAPCPVEVVRAIQERMHCNIAVSYGLTETSPAVSITHFDDTPEARAETVGRALPHIELRVVDDDRKPVPNGQPGELACRGYAVMQGYYRNPEATAAIVDDEGWLYTGDMATMDAAGYVRIVGRKRELIKRGGLTIFPVEVENYLHRHPSVREVAVVGVPDPVLGERVWAYVCLKGAATAEDLAEFCRGRIADYKVPDRFCFLDALPLTPSGKVRKAALTHPDE